MKTTKLLELVNSTLGNLFEQYGLKAVALADDEVLAYSATVRLWLFAQRDGLYVGYLQPGRDGRYFDYSLAPVALKRRTLDQGESGVGRKESLETQLRSELEFYQHFLEQSGDDILKGDENWLKEYPRAPLRLPASTEQKIRTCLNG